MLKGPGPGRPPSMRNKVSNLFLQDVYESWKENGRDVLKVLADRHIETYARIVAGCLPKELVFEPVLDGQSVEELDAIISAIKQHVLAKPGEPLLIEGEVIHELDKSPAREVGGDTGPSGSVKTAKARRRKAQD